MSDDQSPEALWAQYDALASNPVLQARFAVVNRLHEHPRPPRPASPNGIRGFVENDPGRAQSPTPKQIAEALAWARR